MVGAAIKFLRENCEATDNWQVVAEISLRYSEHNFIEHFMNMGCKTEHGIVR